MSRLAELGERNSRAKAEAAEAKRMVIRSAMADAGTLTFADSMKETFGATLTYFKFGDIEIGTPPERGISVGDMVLLDLERKQAEKAAQTPKGKRK